MPEFEGVSQDVFDELNAISLEETQAQQQQQTLGVPSEAPPTQPETPAAAPVEPAAEEAPEEERVAGKEGTVRGNPLQGIFDAVGGAADALAENIDGGQANIIDAVDNMFLGDQRTREEIVANRKQIQEDSAAQMQEKVQRMKESNPVGAAVADTLVRAVPGGAIDAVEDVLGAAEVVGDTVKTFATLGNVHESQNPFSNNYDWAQWKLGADEIGAKTAVGKFAQELVSFASIGSRLGAFKSFGGAANATTKLGKAGQFAKAGLIEAGYGMATDAVKGLAGEGNFANMLETLIPGLKDTWVTALAVDEDDNPWESAVKSALDGAAIGFPTGVIGAWASATRAVKNLPADQQAAKFTEVFAEKIQQTELELVNTKAKPPKELRAHEVFAEASDGDYSRLNQLNATELRSLMHDYNLAEFSSPRDILQNVDPFTSYEAMGEAIFNKKLPNGTNIEWSLRDVSDEFAVREGTFAQRRQAIEGLVDQGIEVNPQTVRDEMTRQGIIPDQFEAPLQGRKVNRIDWDLSDADAYAGGLGREATQMFKQFSEVTSDTLKPGDIMMTEAAEDGFGAASKSGAQERAALNKNSNRNKAAKNWVKQNDAALQEQYLKDIGQTDPEYWTGLDMQAKWDHFDGRQVEGVEPFKVPDSEKGVRQRLYERAGFSAPEPDGRMYGVVRKDKRGRARLEPLDMAGDIDAQIAKAQEGSAAQLSLPALDVVEQRVKAGVPVYWDDVAAEVPQMFTPGTRVIENPEFPPEVLKRLRDPGPGVSINPFTGEEPTTGFMVAIDGKTLKSFEPDSISDFIAQNYDILTREDAYLGARVSEITGKPVVEISRRVESLDEAKGLGQAFDQEGIFDASMQTGDDGYHPTGGINRLKETQGFHQKSAYTQKNYVREPGDAQSVAALQFRPGAPNGAIGGRIMTDEQLHLLGDAIPEYASKQLDEVITGMDVTIDDVVASSRLSRAEIMENVSDDISDFIDAGGRIDISKLPTEALGDDRILTREGAMQTRVLIKNIAGTIWDEARMISVKDGQNIDVESSMEVMVDGLKALARLRKKTVNVFGVRLADEGMPLKKPNVFDHVFTPSKAQEQAEQVAMFNLNSGELDAVEKALDDMVDGFKSGDQTRIRQAMRTAEFLQLTGGDPTKLVKVAKGIPQLVSDVALKHMYNSMLSSPATHFVNNLSNFTNTLARPLQAALGGEGKAAAAAFYNFKETLSESWNMAAQTWTGESLAQGQKVAADSSTKLALDNLAERVKLGNATNVERFSSGLLNMLYDVAEWPVLSWPSKFLTTSDEFFKAMNARMEFRTQSYLEAAQRSDGDTDALFKELLAKNKESAFGKKTGQVMDEQLLDVAKELTYQTSLEGPAGRFASFIDANPLLRPFFPFVKTGHNIMVYTGTHVPVLNLALSESRRALNGELGPYAKAVHKGRIAMGSMFMGMAGVALAGDILTGAGPAEKNAREAWLRTHQPRSIKVGDTWYSYDRLEPYGQVLSAVADIHHALTTGELEHDQAAYKVNYLIYALSTNFSDKSFFQGVKDLATLLNPSGPGVLNRLQSITLGTANNFLPASGMRRAVYNSMTPYMQEYHRAGVDRTLQQMGVPIEAPADRVDFLDGSKLPASQGGFLNAIMPIKAVTKESDVVRDALDVIEFDASSIRKELGDIKLTPKQSNRLNELMAETGLYDAIKDIVTKPAWAKSVQDHKDAIKGAPRVGPDGQSVRPLPKESMLYYRLITAEIRKAQKIALDYLLGEDNDLLMAYTSNKEALNRAKLGQVDGLITLPNR